MSFSRRSGVLLHPTSLPGPFGIGDLGRAAHAFVDTLAAAGQSYWQVLPLSPTGYGDSPYQSLSAFAGNPMLISPERLAEAGHLPAAALHSPPTFPDGAVDFGPLIEYKTQLLEQAYRHFQAHGAAQQKGAFAAFSAENSAWLDDVALFLALKQHYDLRPWHEWDAAIARRRPAALDYWRAKLAAGIEEQKYRQWQFFGQWLSLKRYANSKGVRIIGDLPLYVARDSADVWAHPDLFQVNRNLEPTVVSGVPPDYFSATGQLWGHPIYRWRRMARRAYSWWIDRFRMAFRQADVVRIDHFRGFYNYWEVPAGQDTAINGRWRPGPGAPLFRAVSAALGPLAIIAEDLGDFDVASRAGVTSLQRTFGYPGMKVLQFAFGDGPDDAFLPHNYDHDCVVYTGTHDNNTTAGWYATARANEQDYARKYLAEDGSTVAWSMIRLAWSSVADTAITTVQDILGLGSKARLNTPSTTGAPNWCWRMPPEALTPALAQALLELTGVYGRLPRPAKN